MLRVIRNRPQLLWAILPIGAVIHLLSLRYALKVTLPAAATAGLIALAIVKHLGILGSIYARFRKRPPK